MKRLFRILTISALLALSSCAGQVYAFGGADSRTYNVQFGTHAERLALPTPAPLNEFYETDTGSYFKWYGTWIQTARPNSSGYAITQTAVTMNGSSQALIAANANRRYLGFMVVGPASITCAPGVVTVTAGQGFIYQGGGSGQQGGAQEFPSGAPTNAFSCIGSAGTIVYIWEGV